MWTKQIIAAAVAFSLEEDESYKQYDETMNTTTSEITLRDDSQLKRERQNRGKYNLNFGAKELKENDEIRIQVESSLSRFRFNDINWWNDMQNLNVLCMKQVISPKFSKLHVSCFVKRCWEALRYMFTERKFRTSNIHKSALHFAANSTKLFEVLLVKGVTDIALFPSEFFYHVVGSYLCSASNMNLHSRQWMQAKETLKHICSCFTISDVLLNLLSVLTELQQKFIRVHATKYREQNNEFITFAILQIQELMCTLTQRMEHLQRMKNFSLSL